ncbi:MAG: DUF721 domain-containing protein [Chromatiales bacterium]|nr:DUF721 domain-containing protein [Chromatiales bacterium]
MPIAPRSVSRLLRQDSGPLARLRSGLEIHERNLALIREQLPETLRPQVLGVSHNAGQLRILVSSPLWATRLRYLEARLLEVWHELGGETCTRVKTRVQPIQAGPDHKPRRATPLSSNSASNLNTIAEGVTDPALRVALARLARRSADKRR